LTDEEWALLEPLLPADPPRGGRWRDHRTTISGILFRERTGITWRELPERFGAVEDGLPTQAAVAMDATWAAFCDALRIDCDVEAGRDWTIGVDSSVVRVHQHAAGARHVPARDHAGRKVSTRAQASILAERAPGARTARNAGGSLRGWHSL
jgi:transposase